MEKKHTIFSKTMCIILSVIMLLSAMPLTIIGFADTEGNFTYEVEDGEVTITDYPEDATGAVTIPSKIEGYPVTRIGNYAFYKCTGLTSITIPDSVTSISYWAFYRCIGFTSVEIPDSVTSIGDKAFYGCTGLKTVTIGNSVTSIGGWAFSGCSGLENITVSSKNTVYHSAGNCLIETESKTLILGCKNSVIPADGSVTSIGEQAFEDCTGLASITIPDSVTDISYRAFFECTGLTSIEIPNSVTSIGEYAFDGCTGLTSITIPDSVTRIGYNAFEDCTGLTSITIGNNVTSIAPCAFEGCTGLTSITIGNNVTFIGGGAFSGCSGLESITVSSKNTVYHSAGNCLIETESKTLISGCKNSVIPTDDSVTSIDGGAFRNCTGLTSITIPDSVTSIGYEAFIYCTGLTSITIPDSVTSISEGAFYGCTGLTSIYIPSSVTEIDGGAVPEETLLLVEAGSYAESWAEENGYAYTYIDSAYVNIDAPSVTNESNVTVSGYATPCNEVIIYVNGKENTKTTSNANGYYSAQVNFSAAGEYTVKASVTHNKETVTKEIKIKYDELSAAFCEFDFVHSYSFLHIASDAYMRGKPSVTWVPGTSSSAKVKISNSDRVSKLYLVSTKNGESKKLELTYNASSDIWTATGYFGNDTSYTPGALSITGTYTDGKDFDLGVIFNINFVIDPSGYVYEAVRSNPVKGVTVKICYKDEKGKTVMWNAEEYEQINPVVTAADGAFAWDVPEGQWKVIASKDGYETAETEWMDVPPERKNVYIGINSEEYPEVKTVNVYSDYALIEFSQYMDISTVNSSNISFNGISGKFEALDKTQTYAGSGVYYAKLFKFTPNKKFDGEIKITVNGAANYCGNSVEDYSTAIKVIKEPKNFLADADVSFIYTENGTVNISAENAGGMTVNASVNNALVTLDKTSIVLDENGKGEFVLKSDIPGESVVTFTLDGTALTAQTKITVTPEVKVHVHTLDKVAAVSATCTTEGNSEYYECSDCGMLFGDAKAEKEISLDEVKINAIGHKVTSVAAKAATATEKGNKAYYKCSRCGKLFSDKACTKETTLAEVTIPVIEQTFTYGDVDADGNISAADARLALRASVGLENYAKDSDKYKACDVDADGNVTAADARLILRASVGLEDAKTFGKK